MQYSGRAIDSVHPRLPHPYTIRVNPIIADTPNNTRWFQHDLSKSIAACHGTTRTTPCCPRSWKTSTRRGSSRLAYSTWCVVFILQVATRSSWQNILYMMYNVFNTRRVVQATCVAFEILRVLFHPTRAELTTHVMLKYSIHQYYWSWQKWQNA